MNDLLPDVTQGYPATLPGIRVPADIGEQRDATGCWSANSVFAKLAKPAKISADVCF
jgi:hypothetical protein